MKTTPEEFKQMMKEIAKKNDTEKGHIEADHLMCDLLRELGYQEGADIFEEMGKWYS